MTETTVYVGGLLEKTTVGTQVDWRHYIKVGTQTIAVMSRQGTGTNTTRYMLEDHQGSVANIMDGAGVSYVTESFTAFGARRDPVDWSGDCPCPDLAKIAGVSRMGYTGHEAIGGISMGLNHMNGRVQDAITGRFLSADPYTTEPGNTQGFNRYSYVMNNPMSFTDPSGFQCATSYAPVCTNRDGGAWIGDSWSRWFESITVTASRINDSSIMVPSEFLSGQLLQTSAPPFWDPVAAGNGDPAGPVALRSLDEVIVSAANKGPKAQNLPCSAANSSGNGVLIQLAYTDAHSSGHSIGDASHAFVIAIDPGSGQMYASRGGPGSGNGGGATSRSNAFVANSGLLNANFPDQLSQVHSVQTVGYVNTSFNQVAGYMNAFAEVTNSSNLSYWGPVQNSNSYAFTLTEGLGFDRPTPAVSAPGHGTNTVNSRLSCTKP